MDKERVMPYPLRIPAEIRNSLERMANQDSRSLNNFIVLVLRDFVEKKEMKIGQA